MMCAPCLLSPARMTVGNLDGYGRTGDRYPLGGPGRMASCAPTARSGLG